MGADIESAVEQELVNDSGWVKAAVVSVICSGNAIIQSYRFVGSEDLVTGKVEMESKRQPVHLDKTIVFTM